MVNVEKLNYASLVARGGLKMLSKKSMAFFEDNDEDILGAIFSKYVDNDDEISLEFNEEYLAQIGISVKKYCGETFLGFGASEEYVVLKNEREQILIYCLAEDNIYFVDEIFDEYQVLYNGYWDLGYSILEKDFLLYKGNKRYLLHELELTYCGEEIATNAFYNNEEKTLYLQEWNLVNYSDVENVKVYTDKYMTIEFTMKGKKCKKIYKNDAWTTPIFWKLFAKK